MGVRRALFAAGALAVVLGGLLGLRRERARAACFPVAGRHAVWFHGVRVFDGEGALPSPTDVLVVDQTIADLLLVEGDPVQDVTATRAIVGVYKRGAAAP
jgi:hypothetical protein